MVELQSAAVSLDSPADQEENLLIEAVALLVQRQRETEAWVTEQLTQAGERSTAAERRFADLSTRLTAIEDQLDRLIRDMEPVRSDAAVDERVARLREQVEGLKSERPGPDAPARPQLTRSPTRPVSSEMAAPRGQDSLPRPTLEQTQSPVRGDALETAVVHAESAPQEARHTARIATDHAAEAPAGPRPRARAAAMAPRDDGPSFLELLGSTPADRFGLVLIGLGMIAVLYALLTQLRFA